MQLRRLALALIVAPLAGCGLLGDHIGKSFSGVEGTGPEKSETRKASGFSRIRINRAIQATISVDGKDSVEIKAQESLLPIITTKVENGELIVDADKDYSSSNPVQAIIHCASLESLHLSGASTANVTGAMADKLSLGADGASRINLKGEAKAVEASLSGASTLVFEGKSASATIDASGASTADLQGLALNSLSATASGASTVKTGSIKSLDADASGASNITYQGEPKIIRNESSGASNVSAR